MTRDRGRSEVYAAEVMAFEGTDLEAAIALEHLVEVARELTHREWWVAGPVEIRAARSGAVSSNARPLVDGTHRVSIAASQCTRATLLHELAHVLAGVAAGHGAVFRRAHVDVVSAVAGAERASWLHDAYRAAGLPLGEREADRRTWVEPPPADAPIAL